MDFIAVINDIIDREGGFVNNSADRGGPTKFGITAKTLGQYRNLGRPATAEEVKALTKAEAIKIYEKKYIKEPGFDFIEDEPLLSLLIDTAVHSGVKTAVEFLQDACGVLKDGIIGKQTKEVVLKTDPRVIYRNVLAARVVYLGRLVTYRPSQHVFAFGWAKRVSEFIKKTPL